MSAEFTVYQMFVGGQFERVNDEPLDAQGAVQLAESMTKTVGASIGSTCRVLITDGGDEIVWQWSYGEGLQFPSRDEV